MRRRYPGGLLVLPVVMCVVGTCILAFTTGRATLSIDTTPTFLLMLPEDSAAFHATDLSRDRQEEAHEAECE